MKERRKIKIEKKYKKIILIVFILFLVMAFINMAFADTEEDDDGSWYSRILSGIRDSLGFLRDIKDSVQNIENNFVQWVMNTLLEFPIALGETIIDIFLNPLAAVVPEFLLETIEIENIPILDTIWKACYIIALVLLVILTALGLGFGGNEAFKYDNFGEPEHILVRFFFTLGLISASKYIAVTIYHIAAWMTNVVFSDAAMAISTAWDVTGVEGFIKLVLYAIFLLPAIILNIGIFVILIIRVLDLMMLTALSPISAATFVLPNTKDIATRHLREYISVILVQFIMIVFLALWTGLATFMDGLMLQFTGEFALSGLAQIVGQGIMLIVLMIYSLTRPGWLKRMLGVGSSSSIGGLLAMARMFI